MVVIQEGLSSEQPLHIAVVFPNLVHIVEGLVVVVEYAYSDGLRYGHTCLRFDVPNNASRA